MASVKLNNHCILTLSCEKVLQPYLTLTQKLWKNKLTRQTETKHKMRWPDRVDGSFDVGTDLTLGYKILTGEFALGLYFSSKTRELYDKAPGKTLWGCLVLMLVWVPGMNNKTFYLSSLFSLAITCFWGRFCFVKYIATHAFLFTAIWGAETKVNKEGGHTVISASLITFKETGILSEVKKMNTCTLNYWPYLMGLAGFVKVMFLAVNHSWKELTTKQKFTQVAKYALLCLIWPQFSILM